MRAATEADLATMITDAMARGDWAAVATLEPRLDQAARPRPAARCVDAGLFYASLGLRVFPLQPRSKIPFRGSRGCHDATTDPGQIRAWWERWPDANLGIATGHLVDVVDIDGPDGVASWAELVDELPPTLGSVSTPRAGGTHLYVAAAGVRNGAKIAPGLDIRGLGGYVVAPPSYVVVADKGYEGTYRWRRPLVLPALDAVAA